MGRLILGAVVVLLGCDALTGPEYRAPGMAPLQPVPSWRVAYAGLERCARVEGPGFDRIRWFEADAITFEGVPARGLWIGPHTIVLKRGLTPVRRNGAARHEMLHHILQVDAHPKPPFESCERKGASRG